MDGREPFSVENEGWFVEARGGRVLVYKPGVRTNPAKLIARIERSLAIRQVLLERSA
jgi:hypothetical protein